MPVQKPTHIGLMVDSFGVTTFRIALEAVVWNGTVELVQVLLDANSDVSSPPDRAVGANMNAPWRPKVSTVGCGNRLC
jgi:hypothetical protein